MSSFLDDFRYTWYKPENGLSRLLIINIAVFVILSLLWLFSKFAGDMTVYEFVQEQLGLSSRPSTFLLKPWTFITYFFTHYDFFHILSNMLGLYWFGLILQDFVGSKKLVSLYFLGGLAGATAYLLAYNFIPYFAHHEALLVGASGGVFAVVVGAATFTPDTKLFLLFFGPVKIKYLAVVYVFLSLLGTAGANAGGSIAHLGGALLGYIFVKQLRRGNDWGKPLHLFFDFISQVFKPKPKMKVTYRRDKAYAGKTTTSHQKSYSCDLSAQGVPDQETIDAILDKISEQGYDKLTTEEKQILFKASQKR
ncbi:MAG: rhomboid family intramembrane serine protease [Flammeovirgaceae bacterium]|nr:rhomboid family intramembrane serine protease [Flammeovirgaceae bacterium]MDW8286576.1 rhomboid family intramembrane serine protease [Flammeovirgaceae bacterium]